MKRLIILLCSLILIAPIALYSQTVTVTLPDTTIYPPNTQILIPIRVSNLSGLNVYSYQSIVTFDTTVINAVSAESNGSITSPWGPPIYNIGISGQISFGGFGTSPLSGSGDLVYLKFDVIGDTGSTSLLDFTSFGLNAGNPASTTTNGSVTIGLNPSADFTGSPTYGLKPLIVQFTDVSTGAISGWLWDFGDSGSSTQKNPLYTYIDAGIYSVKLTITGPGGSDTITKNNYITVNNPIPTISSIFPTNIIIGDPGFTMTVNGGNFINTSVVRFDSNDRTTNFISSTQLTAEIPASDLTASGTYNITVFNPAPGGGESNAQTFKVNAPPVALNDSVTTDEDIAVTVDVLANDSDTDGTLVPATVIVTSGPPNGGTSVNTSTGAVTYTPAANWYGVDIFTYTVEDNDGNVSNTATVKVTVDSLNDPPVISTLPIFVFNEDDSLVYSILGFYNYVEDPDHPDSTLIFTFYNGSFVTVMLDSPNVIMKAQKNWFGSDTLELIVLDPEFSADTAQVFVSVRPSNDAPVFVNWPDTVQFTDLSDTVLTMIDYVNDIDSPDTSLTWMFNVSDDSVKLQFDTVTTELTLTAPGFIGEVTLYCTVTDDSSASAQDSFTVKVIRDPTGIDDFVIQIPDKYFLNQNYPNPFNPVTKIKYGLPKSGKVKIEIYNIIGQKVLILLDEFKNAGYHAIDFDAGKLPSGIYFYRIQTKEFHDVKKMILIK